LNQAVGENAEGCSNCVAVRLGADKPEANAVVSRKLIVAVQVGWTIVRSQEQVEVTIAIEVSIG
jgi:hypothetical protein